MTMMRNYVLALACSLGPLAACDLESAGEDPFTLDDATLGFRCSSGNNGTCFNTNVVFGVDAPNYNTAGKEEDGVKLLGVSVQHLGQWRSVNGLHVEDGELRGEIKSPWMLPTIVSGLDFLYSRWKLQVNGAVVEINIGEMDTAANLGFYSSLDPDARFSPGRWMYKFYYVEQGVTLNTCDDDRWAVLTDFKFDLISKRMEAAADNISTVCEGDAGFKAFHLGFAPDRPSPILHGVEITNAAIAAVTADPCLETYNSYTLPNHQFSLRDAWGIHSHTADPTYHTEAFIMPDADAYCFSIDRANGEFLSAAAPAQCSGATIPFCPSDQDLETLIAENPGLEYLWVKSPIEP